ncbi:MAG: glycosyltransferase family 2 protein [Chloroflexota bacterium]
MNISVIVVTLNEERRLKDCLESLKRFNDLKVVDLGSSDRSVEIAQEMGHMVVTHPWVPIGEMVLPTVMPTMKNDWIIRVDPDEVLPPDLIDDLNDLEPDEKDGIISVPYQYYFINKRLDTTVWGGLRQIPRVINRKRVVVEPEVHRALQCKPGYKTIALPHRSENAVKHYWNDSYSQLFSKHTRYIPMEGKSRYNDGQRFSLKALLLNPLRSLKYSLINCSGWHGGWHGWFLSFFFASYELGALLSLHRYERQIKK